MSYNYFVDQPTTQNVTGITGQTKQLHNIYFLVSYTHSLALALTLFQWSYGLRRRLVPRTRGSTPAWALEFSLRDLWHNGLFI